MVFLGRLPPDEVPIALSTFDVLAHTSVHEGLARVLPQGVLAGLPVVSFDLDGAGEVVRDGENGFLVPPRDTDALTERLEVLVRDAALRARLGGVGAEQIREEFSIAQMVRKLDALYRRARRLTHVHSGDAPGGGGRSWVCCSRSPGSPP